MCSEEQKQKSLQYYYDHIDERRQYYQNNKDKRHQYYQNNKDKLNEKSREYYYDNIDKFKEYHNKYYNEKRYLKQDTQKYELKDEVNKLKKKVKYLNMLRKQSLNRRKYIQKKINTITIDQDAKLVIYWND